MALKPQHKSKHLVLLMSGKVSTANSLLKNLILRPSWCGCCIKKEIENYISCDIIHKGKVPLNVRIIQPFLLLL